jgi:hypothetical protein
MKKVFVLLAVALVLAGCAVDPRNAADADRTRSLTAQDAADREQARSQQAEGFAVQQAELEETSGARAEALARVMTFASWAGGIVILAGAVGLAWGEIGIGRAAARAVYLRANSFSLSALTRQYPVFLQDSGAGRFSLVNPNSGAVMLLDASRAENPQMVSVLGAVQLAGVVAESARKSENAEGVALIAHPAIVEDKSSNVRILARREK